MASETSIANMALMVLGQRSISARSEPSNSARNLDAVWDIALEGTLADHPWGFATKSVALAQSSEAMPPGGRWTRQYLYPADCLRALGLVSPVPGGIPPEFEVVHVDGLRLVLTDQDRAVLRYIARITNPAVFDPQFVEAFAYRLAMLVAPRLVGKGVAQEMADMYAWAVARATVGDAQEVRAESLAGRSFLDARH